MLTLRKKLLIYIPTYNCEKFIVETIREIPISALAEAELIVIDNCSTDNTVQKLTDAIASGAITCDIHIIRPTQNLGYAGSQKLAYRLACATPAVEWVQMLHGDGQYPPALIPDFLACRSNDIAIVYGVRNKKIFGAREETPFVTFHFIKLLSLLESIITGVWRREWHTGYMLYSTRFLRAVPLSRLTSTPHIDGHLLLCSAKLGKTAKAVPIYKRYHDYEAFAGTARIAYVANVLRLMWQFRRWQLPDAAEAAEDLLPAYQMVFSTPAA